MGEQRVGPPPGTGFIEADDLGLEMRAVDIAPWIMTWRDLFDAISLARYCFVDKRVSYEFKADVWIDDVLRESVDVHIWEPPESDMLAR